MLNKNILLTVGSSKCIRQQRIEDDNLILISTKENDHDNSIYILLNIGDGHIIFGSKNNKIKIW